jgi:hypothetical protein
MLQPNLPFFDLEELQMYQPSDFMGYVLEITNFLSVNQIPRTVCNPKQVRNCDTGMKSPLSAPFVDSFDSAPLRPELSTHKILTTLGHLFYATLGFNSIFDYNAFLMNGMFRVRLGGGVKSLSY